MYVFWIQHKKWIINTKRRAQFLKFNQIKPNPKKKMGGMMTSHV